METEGVLHRVSARAWQGSLGGYRVDVFRRTLIVLRGRTLAEAAARARNWIEAQIVAAGNSRGHE